MLSQLASRIERVIPPQSRLRNVTMLAGSSVAAQAITILIAPISTRIYSPADYGMATVFNTVLAVVAIVASGRFELALPLPEDDESAVDVLLLGGITLLATTVVSALALLVWGGQIAGLLHAAALAPYLWILPIGVLGAGCYQLLNYWALRKKAYSCLARTKLNQSITSAGVNVGVGMLYAGPLGLLLSNILAQSAGIGTLARVLRPHRAALRHPSAARLRTALVNYRKFPLFSCGASLLNSMSNILPVFLLTAWYGVEVTGHFGLAQRLISIPVQLVGGSVSQVFLGEVAHALREQPREVPVFFARVTKRMLKVSLLILVAGAAAQWLMPLIFGARWALAGQYAMFLTIFCAIQLVVSPVSTIATLLKRQDLQLLLDAICAVVVFLLFYIPHCLQLTGTTVIAIYSIGNALLYLMYYLVYKHLADGVTGE